MLRDETLAGSLAVGALTGIRRAVSRRVSRRGRFLRASSAGTSASRLAPDLELLDETVQPNSLAGMPRACSHDTAGSIFFTSQPSSRLRAGGPSVETIALSLSLLSQPGHRKCSPGDGYAW
jgi:hypothetical protein